MDTGPVERWLEATTVFCCATVIPRCVGCLPEHSARVCIVVATKRGSSIHSVFRKFTKSCFCCVCETDTEALVVEVDHVHQGGCRTVVKIGRTRRQSSQNRSLELADVGALTGNQRSAGVGDDNTTHQ